jgi:hypothetical protein
MYVHGPCTNETALCEVQTNFEATLYIDTSVFNPFHVPLGT